jgi:WD40 repeat protein
VEITTSQAVIACVMIAVSVGCSGGPPSRNESGPPVKRIASSGVQAKPRARRVAPPDTPAAPEDTADNGVGARPAEPMVPRRPLAVRLPVDDGFVLAPLPAVDPERYREWSNRGEIRVGKSHLYHADLLDGERLLLAMSSEEGSVRVYERSTRELLGNFAIPGLGRFEGGAVASWPDSGDEPLFLFGKSDGLWLFSAASGERVALLDEGPVGALRWSPDRRILMTVISETSTQISTMVFFVRSARRALERLATIPFPERVDAWSLSRDNRFLAVLYYPSDTMELVDLHAGEPLFRVPTPEFGGDVMISPDGRSIAMGGAGLLLVDASDPSRRTLYSRFANNIGRVRFSPSADAIVTSSYDGKIRIFGYDLSWPRLELKKTLSHAGSANVYELLFFDRGAGLISTSGDQTIRYWGGKTSALKSPPRMPAAAKGPVYTPPKRPAEPSTSRPAISEVPSTEEERRAQLAALYAMPRHRPSILDGPPRPSRIQPGRYSCRVSEGYKLRDCVVEEDPADHVMLEVMAGNLIEMRGVLYNDGPVVRFEGWPTAKRPFGCFSCQEGCFIHPGTCGCQPRALEQVAGCLRQPLHAVFRGKGATWRGVVLYRGYYDEQIPVEALPRTVAFEEGIDRYTIVLKRRGYR